jgi:type I restriction enzyme S subunit
MLEERAPQAAQKNINLEILRALSVPVPPINLQRRYEQHCLAVSSIIKEQSEGENKANAMFRSLLARLFGQDKQHATMRGSLPLEGVPCEEEHGAMTG